MYWLPRRKVLVPTDFSDASADAMHTALAMVEYGHCVHALHIVEPVLNEFVNGEIPSDVDLSEAEDTRLRIREERLKTFLSERELRGLVSAVQTGDPALSITRYACDNAIDLIVVAAHNYEQGERISMGSVTERVLHNADCPVLVLRPDGRVSRKPSRAGVRESNGFASVENPSHAVSASSRPR